MEPSPQYQPSILDLHGTCYDLGKEKRWCYFQSKSSKTGGLRTRATDQRRYAINGRYPD